jgi:6-pyruvoyltetrahydropterin/6-carboxytetrahydropterin synthase
MFEITIEDNFSSAHYLRNYNGVCENLHGHNWKVVVTVEGKTLNETGLLIDFKELKKILKNILQELDHKLLNDLPFFQKNNPSSENIARYIFEKLKENLGHDPRLKVKKVTVFENEKTSASYYEI